MYYFGFLTVYFFGNLDKKYCDAFFLKEFFLGALVKKNKANTISKFLNLAWPAGIRMRREIVPKKRSICSSRPMFFSKNEASIRGTNCAQFHFFKKKSPKTFFWERENGGRCRGRQFSPLYILVLFPERRKKEKGKKNCFFTMRCRKDKSFSDPPVGSIHTLRRKKEEIYILVWSAVCAKKNTDSKRKYLIKALYRERGTGGEKSFDCTFCRNSPSLLPPLSRFRKSGMGGRFHATEKSEERVWLMKTNAK